MASSDQDRVVLPGQEQPAGGVREPAYVREAMRGLTKVQRQAIIDGCFHGDFSMATMRSLRARELFYLHIDSPNGRAGFMRLTPLGVTVQAILKSKAA